MSLPDGFLDELRARLSLVEVAGRKVAWDSRKSNPRRGDMWAPCPFHQERTASFHVDDSRGFYYCFGCHAKGDAIGFVRETENVGFMEAVEILAREAGMEMPRRDPEAKAKAERRTGLVDVIEQAARFYRRQLSAGAAGEERAYLAGRGLSDATLERWEIGFAPSARQSLFRHLREAGVAAERIVEAGLARRSDDGGAPYDRFRNRIVFPIRDARGRAIAFGGRAMAAGAQAKYLNSPETEIFDKGASLYNHAPARTAAGKGHQLIVAEGYMDAIALSEAGFPAVVAPLGTAVTDRQLSLLWRMHAEPVVALDGDAAGERAAKRVMDTALPLLESGHGLRFALLPRGQDPDDLIRVGGAAAMQRCLDAAEPLVRLFWRRETEGGLFDSPERKAALDKRLRAAVGRIRDPALRRHYGEEIRRLRWEFFDPCRTGDRGRRRERPQEGATLSETKNSVLAAGDHRAGERLQEAVILATLVHNPQLVEEFADRLEELEMNAADHARLRDALLRNAGASGTAMRERLESEVGAHALEKLFSFSHVRLTPAVRQPGETSRARQCVAEEVAKLSATRGAERELAEAIEDVAGQADEGLTWRVSQANAARDRAARFQEMEATQYDIAPSGARMDRAERTSFERLVDEIDFTRGRRRRP